MKQAHSNHDDEMSGYIAHCVTTIAKHGMMVQGLMINPPIAYTVGLSKDFGAEMFIMGLDFENATHFLNAIRNKLIKGEVRMADGELLEEIAQNFTLRFQNAPTGSANKFYVAKRITGSVPIYFQVVYPDENHAFPGEPNCSPRIVEFQDFLRVENQI